VQHQQQGRRALVAAASALVDGLAALSQRTRVDLPLPAASSLLVIWREHSAPPLVLRSNLLG